MPDTVGGLAAFGCACHESCVNALFKIFLGYEVVRLVVKRDESA
jgi:hypothetical protein